MGRYTPIVLALLVGCVFGFIGTQMLFSASSAQEPLFDAPDAPKVNFKIWHNGNWQFKLSGDNPETSAEIAVLENKVLPFKIMTSGSTEPKFFQVDVSSVPHQPFSTVTLVGNEKEGFIKEVELWSDHKIYHMKRSEVGGAWRLDETNLKK
ncbi:MAG: hypothetical protein Q4A84_00720 [Neisseria sp.]|uniref:hypothetical protein n=1 Tax=Neisseria sp. TaxID=192066 RepID=UPI0026DAFFBD|nr:hypothetical protein [Neisseria sp.]MDO4640216.1 hypothetical protein [Neisseria sp.]